MWRSAAFSENTIPGRSIASLDIAPGDPCDQEMPGPLRTSMHRIFYSDVPSPYRSSRAFFISFLIHCSVACPGCTMDRLPVLYHFQNGSTANAQGLLGYRAVFSLAFYSHFCIGSNLDRHLFNLDVRSFQSIHFFGRQAYGLNDAVTGNDKAFKG